MVVINYAVLAPIWTRIGLSCVTFREESEHDTPGTQFGGDQKHELLMTWTAMAPICLKIHVSCIRFREESEYDTPSAQVWTSYPN